MLWAQFGPEFWSLSITFVKQVIAWQDPIFRTIFTAVIKQITMVVKKIMYSLSESRSHYGIQFLQLTLLVGNQLEKSQIEIPWLQDTATLINASDCQATELQSYDHSG